MTEHLWDNSGYAISDGGAIAAGFELGVSWQCIATGAVSRLGWYRVHAGSPAPDTLNLWDHGWGAALARKILPNDNGAVGWQWTDLDLPVPVYIGRRYVVSYHAGVGFHLANFGGGNVLPPTAHLLHGPSGRDVAQSSTTTFPGGHDSTQGPVVDIEWDLQQSSGELDAQQTAQVIDQKLSAWFTSTNDNTHKTELPWLAYGQASGANQNAQNAWISAQDNQTSLAALLERWSDDLATKLGNALGLDGRTLDQIYDGVESGRSEFAAGFADVLERVGEYTGTSLLGYAAELIRWVNGVYSPPQLADTTDWELLDETDFADNLLWPVEADVYRVTLSSFDPAGTSEPVGTETRHGYLGKWCPFNVQFSSEWHYFNTENADLSLGGRMPGLGLILNRPGAGHVQAWRRAETP